MVYKNPLFIPGKVYKRSALHDEFGGSGWSGISPSGKNPYIFIFSVASGQQHGYKDEWENDDIYAYTGEGQVGDMQFTRNNLILLEHKKRGRKVFLFIGHKKAYVKFEAELELLDYDFFRGFDNNGDERTAIKFFFKRVGKELNYEPEQNSFSLLEEPEELYKKELPNITERQGLVTSRVGQGAYRKSILYRWNYKCAVTNYSKKEILIASHILPWKDSTNEERLNVDNGILLSPTYDALFDQHLISFENNGKIILSSSFLKSNYDSIGVTGKEKIKNLSVGNVSFLERHRENFT